MPPITLLLQYAVTLTFLAFALASIAVYRGDRRAPPASRAAWALTGYAFLAHALNKAAQGAWGAWAIAEGKGSGVWNAYLVWAPIFDHSRTFLLLGLCGALAALVVRRETAAWGRFYAVSAGVMAVALVLGGVLGWQEKAFRELVHYSAVARWDVVELLVLLGVLFGGLVSSRFDRMLWFCLCVYAFSLALNVLWFAAFSRTGIVGQWAPRPWEIHLYRTVLNLGMCAIVFHRVRLARRGVRVPALLESPQPRPSMAR